MLQMLNKSNTEKMLELFFQYPTRKFHVREIARLLKVSAPTASRLINYLTKEGLVERRKTEVLDEVSAIADSEEFKRSKWLYNLKKLYECGLVSYLRGKFELSAAIIMFGSYSHGEDFERSDIDIAVITKHKTEIKLDKFESALKREISLHQIDLKEASDEFKNSLANGIVLEGYLELI